jgi:hypothetical protein
MEEESTSQTSCYVLDASALIEIEGANGKGLKHMPAYPGKWFVVPSKVAKEVDSKSAPKETKAWINGGKYAKFNSDDEGRLFMRLRVEEIALDDADIEGIVIAYHRNGTYVVEEGPAEKVAKKLGINTIKAKQFLDKVRPRLL